MKALLLVILAVMALALPIAIYVMIDCLRGIGQALEPAPQQDDPPMIAWDEDMWGDAWDEYLAKHRVDRATEPGPRGLVLLDGLPVYDWNDAPWGGDEAAIIDIPDEDIWENIWGGVPTQEAMRAPGADAPTAVVQSLGKMRLNHQTAERRASLARKRRDLAKEAR